MEFVGNTSYSHINAYKMQGRTEKTSGKASGHGENAADVDPTAADTVFAEPSLTLEGSLSQIKGFFEQIKPEDFAATEGKKLTELNKMAKRVLEMIETVAQGMPDIKDYLKEDYDRLMSFEYDTEQLCSDQYGVKCEIRRLLYKLYAMGNRDQQVSALESLQDFYSQIAKVPDRIQYEESPKSYKIEINAPALIDTYLEKALDVTESADTEEGQALDFLY